MRGNWFTLFRRVPKPFWKPGVNFFVGFVVYSRPFSLLPRPSFCDTADRKRLRNWYQGPSFSLNLTSKPLQVAYSLPAQGSINFEISFQTHLFTTPWIQMITPPDLALDSHLLQFLRPPAKLDRGRRERVTQEGGGGGKWEIRDSEEKTGERSEEKEWVRVSNSSLSAAQKNLLIAGIWEMER